MLFFVIFSKGGKEMYTVFFSDKFERNQEVMLRECKKHVQGLKEQLFSARNPKTVEATYQKRAS